MSLRVLPEVKATPVPVKQAPPPRRVASPVRPPPDGQSALLCPTVSSSALSSNALEAKWLKWSFCLPLSDSSESDNLSHLRRSGSSERGETRHRYGWPCSSSKWLSSRCSEALTSSGTVPWLQCCFNLNVFSPPRRGPQAANGTGTLRSGISVKSNPPVYCKAQFDRWLIAWMINDAWTFAACSFSCKKRWKDTLSSGVVLLWHFSTFYRVISSWSITEG